METLSKRLASLKTKLVIQQNQNDLLNTSFSKVIKKIFPAVEKKFLDAHIQEIYQRGNDIIVKTTSKSFAQEIFLQRTKLEEDLSVVLNRKKVSLVIY